MDRPLDARLSNKVFKFRKGHNLHSLFAIWGQIDQYCMQKQRLMRLMALGNVIEQTKMTKESFVKVHQEFFKLNCQLNAMSREIQQEYKMINENMIRNCSPIKRIWLQK